MASSPSRLSRFSKIGGQMVPHIRIEGKLHALADATEQVFPVTAVPDEGIEPDVRNTGAGAGSSYVIDPLCSPSASLFMATSTDGSPDGQRIVPLHIWSRPFRFASYSALSAI